ncbi:4-hydroxyphenylpyruvate dioxygenase [Sessilibacter sp. MAH1]
MNQQSKYVEVTDISFIEFSGPNPKLLDDLFKQMGFSAHQSADQTFYNISDINFISNPTSGGSAAVFRAKHVRGASAMGFKVANSQQAFELAVSLGAEPVENADLGIPAIKGVGAALIYLVDDEHEAKLFAQYGYVKSRDQFSNCSLSRVDHLTHNLHIGGVARMIHFYETIFGFSRIRKFDINGKKTGLISEVVSSPNGRVVIPLNESKDDKSQIAEYLDEYNGEGIQHIALLTDDIFDTVTTLKFNGIPFQDTLDTYYEQIDERLPGHGEDVAALHKEKILIDGGESQGGGLLLQIFTKNSIGPIFFEFIERKGNKGFGEGNFQALFDSIELDQERRGVI